ncbi:MAG: putative porin [Deltaproteobacteria bacterium]|nr:putative porin [Deltaproteobacteria bacterium]
MGKILKRISVFILVMGVLTSPVLFADETKAEPPMEDTIEALIDLLKSKGVIGDEEADKFIKRYKSGIPAKREKGTVVTIIPEQEGQEYIERITEDVNKALKEDVVKTKEDLDYMSDELMTRSRLLEKRADAIDKKLVEDVGNKLNQVSWANRMRWGGDIRLRYEKNFYDEENYDQLYDPEKNEIVNTTVDRARYRYRVRLEANAEIMKKNPDMNVGKVDAGARIATGSTNDPVSTNDTLGDYLNKDSIVLDNAYLKWTYKPDYPKFGRFPQVTAWGGRFANPFYSTDMVWDSDVNFEGLAVKLESDTLLANPLKFFLTMGAFPLQELELYEKDKWLFAGQFVIKYEKSMSLSATTAISYYNYKRTRGEFFNDPSGSVSFGTEPLFRQIGNAMIDINTDPNNETYALAGEYRLLNISTELDYDYWFPKHIILKTDYVKNIGFDAKDVARMMNLTSYPEEIEGYQIGLLYGYPKPMGFAEWNTSLTYRYVEGDAVFDAFTDSDFHLSGANAKGWILQSQFGLSERLWLSIRWISSDEVRSVPIAIDKFFIDLNARF